MNADLEIEVPERKRAYGKIIKVSSEGWGFITSKEIEFTRIFFHWTALQRNTINFKELHSGMYCEFTPIEIEGKGWRAIQICIVEKRKHDSIGEGEEISHDSTGIIS